MTHFSKISLKNIILVAFLAITSLFFYGCNAVEKDSLYLVHNDTILYKCEDGSKITANYYSLSDDSYWFSEIILPDGKKHTLINVKAASGAKFMNDVIVWWTKGDKAFTEIRDHQGEWQIDLRCKQISD